MSDLLSAMSLLAKATRAANVNVRAFMKKLRIAASYKGKGAKNQK
jgi:hypothetical protein